MMQRLISALGILLLILTTSLGANDDTNAPRLQDKVKEIQLDNGLKIVVVERPSAPVFFSLMNFRVGSTIEQIGKSGLSHFMEHMLFKGSETIGTKDYSIEKPIMDELEKVATEMRDTRISIEQWRFDMFEEYAAEVKSSIGGQGSDGEAKWVAVLNALPTDHAELPEEWQKTSWVFSHQGHDYWADYRRVLEDRNIIADLIKQQREQIIQTHIDGIYTGHGAQMLNAFTAYDQTGYMVGLPSNCLELWMNVEADRFQNPVFREFYSEREVVQEELLGNQNNPFRFLYSNFLQGSYTAHPYGRPIIGWQNDIQTTLRSEMDEHFRKFYAPNNCQMTIVGNVDAEEVFSLARKHFSSWKTGEVAHTVTVKEPEQHGERRISVEFNAEPRLITGYHVPAAPHPDYYPLQMVVSILYEGRTSRFYRSIFQEQGLTAGPPMAMIGPSDRYPGMLALIAGPNAGHTIEEVEQAMYAELDKLKNEPVSDFEIERIHNRYQTTELTRLRSNQSLAFSLSGGFVNTGDWRSIIENYDRLMAVTPEDIQRVAKKYFTSTNRTVAFTVKPVENIANAEVIQGGVGQ